MKYIYMNCLQIIRAVFVTAMMATCVSVASADGNANGVRKESCALYEITLPAHWIAGDPVSASAMPPVRGALLLDATGGETKCHLYYQSWQFFDKNHFEDSQSCHIQSYILPDGSKVDIDFLRAMLDRQSRHPGSWKKIEHGYMKTVVADHEGLKVGAAGFEKVVAYNRSIEVLLEGSDYVHHLSIIVPENRYRSDEQFRRAVDNIWKTWKMKK